MADHHHPRLLAQPHIIAQPPTPATAHIIAPPIPSTSTTATLASSILRNLQKRASSSKQLFGVLTLVVTGAILLILTGLTVVVAIVGLILFSPLIIVLSPIWVPACAAVFLVTAGFLSTCGFGIIVMAVFTWMYRYFRGLYAPRDHVGVGGYYYLQTKVAVDSAAPGA